MACKLPVFTVAIRAGAWVWPDQRVSLWTPFKHHYIPCASGHLHPFLPRRSRSVSHREEVCLFGVNKQWSCLFPLLSPQEAEIGREEWMLVPPKSLGVLGAIKTLQPTNRKFQTYAIPSAVCHILAVHLYERVVEVL